MSNSYNSKGFVCEYKKRSAWFGSFEIRYIVIEDERMKVFKNEKEYRNSKRGHSKPSMTVVLRNARLKIGNESRHPHILSIQVRGTHHFLSFVNDEQLRMCQEVMTRVIESANLIRPTLDSNHDNDTDTDIDPHDVNTRYQTILYDLGLPTYKINELIISQSFVSKMDIITQNQYELDLKSRSSRCRSRDATFFIKILRRKTAENVNIAHITDIATALYEESNQWCIQFIHEQGLSLLVRLIPHQIKTKNIKFEIELLQCFQAICNKMHENGNDKIGLMYIVSDVTAIQGIIDLFESQDVEVSILIIKLLSVICWHSPEGFEKVMDALELYAQNTNHSSIWIPIILHLKPMISRINDDKFAAEYVLFTIGLINAILNSFCLLEDRVCYRKDLEQLGFDKIITYLSDLICSTSIEEDADDDIWIDKMEEHIDLYQAVKLKDLRDSSLDGIDVSNPIHLFQFLNEHCVEEGYVNEFIHILQCLTAIPRNAPYIWSTIEKIISYSTAPIRKLQLNDVLEHDADTYHEQHREIIENDLNVLSQEPHHAFPSFVQLKALLSRYDQDLEFIDSMQSQSAQYTQQITLLQQQITNLKYKLSEQQLLNDEITKQNKKREKDKRKASIFDKLTQILNINGNALCDDKEVEDIDAHLIDVTNAWKTIGLPPPPPPQASQASHSSPPPKYMKMIQMKIPLLAVENKMKQNGDSQYIEALEYWFHHKPETETETKKVETAETVESPPSELEKASPKARAPPPPPQLVRYLKMNKMHIPLKVIKNKMKQNGDSAHIPLLEEWLNGGPSASAPAAPPPPPQIQKYLKMKKMNIPMKVICNKMKQNGDSQYIAVFENWLNPQKEGEKAKEKEKGNELPPGMKAKPKIIPKEKMKALHWSTIEPKEICNTVWDGLDESQINIETEIFENLFKRKVHKSKTKNNKKTKSKNVNEEIHLIDGKRSYNVDIGLSRFKLSHQEIKDAILLLDETELNLDKVMKLRNYIPDHNEQDLLKTFDGDVTLLAHTESFFLVLSDIVDLPQRMELWHFKLQFDDLFQSQMHKIKILRKCHDNVLKSDSFKTALRYILRFGNYMNGSTRKGQAFGFKLNSLTQVICAKSVDNKTTLLHYIYTEMEKAHPNALRFTDDFDILSEGTRVDITELTAKIKKIGASLKKIKDKLKNDSQSHSKCDLFSPKMTAFLADAQPLFEKLKKEYDSVQSDCNKLAHYFNCKNDLKHEYFKDLYHFSEEFKKTANNIQKQREIEAKQQRNAQIKATRQQRLKKKRSNRANQIYSKRGLAKQRLSTDRQILIENTKRTSLTNSVVYDIKMSAVENRRKASSYKKSRWFGL